MTEGLNGLLSTTMDFASYQWFLNGVAIDGATEATYMPLEVGNYTVEVTDAAGCEFTSEIFEVVTNTDNIEAVSRLAVSPNPFEDKLMIQLETTEVLELNILIYDVQGKLVFEKTMLANGAHTETLSLDSLQAGVYVMHFRTDDGEMTRKIIRK